jgi:hypothetical protein
LDVARVAAAVVPERTGLTRRATFEKGIELFCLGILTERVMTDCHDRGSRA